MEMIFYRITLRITLKRAANLLVWERRQLACIKFINNNKYKKLHRKKQWI